MAALMAAGADPESPEATAGTKAIKDQSLVSSVHYPIHTGLADRSEADRRPTVQYDTRAQGADRIRGRVPNMPGRRFPERDSARC